MDKISEQLSTEKESYQKFKEIFTNVFTGNPSQLEGNCFERMSMLLASALGADYTLIANVTNPDCKSVSTLAVCVDGQITENFEYELAGTPCEKVCGRKTCSYRSGVAELFPSDVMLKDMNVEGYVGAPLFDSKHETLGIVVALFRRPFKNIKFVESTIDIFAGLISVEIGQKKVREDIHSLARFPSENPNPVLRVAKNGVVLYGNDASELLFTNWGLGIRKEVPHKWQNLITKSFEFEEVLEFEEIAGDRAFSFTIAPIKDAEYANIYAIDITEKKRMEEEKGRLSRLVEISKEAVLICSSDLLIVYTNESLDAMFGYQRGELLGQSVHILNAASIDEKVSKEILQEIEIKGWWEGEVINKRKDGTEFICHLTINVNKDKDGNVLSYNSIQHDITKLKDYENQLQIAKEHAEAANIAKSQFLANMSHEIRTPISVITGFSDILVNEELTTDQSSYAEIIRNAGNSLLVIINDILDFSKIESGKLEVTKADYFLKEMLDDIYSILRPMAAKKDLQFTVICSKKLPSIIHTDKDRLRQCLINLVNNAIKFTTRGHVHLNVSIEKSYAKTFIRFDVEDTGIGIPNDMREHIFESFAQVEKGSTRNHGGTGLGLPITSQLAELLGGKLTFTSREHKGSTFSLTIPVGVAIASDVSLENKQPILEVISPKKKSRKYSGKVLVAEDDEGCRVIEAKLLKRLGLEVTTANDGKEAVEKALKDCFDLIFMDVRMPNMDGFEAVEALHQKGVTTTIVALTAHAMEGYSELCVQAGYDDYLSKPIDRKKLLEILDKYLPFSLIPQSGP